MKKKTAKQIASKSTPSRRSTIAEAREDFTRSNRTLRLERAGHFENIADDLSKVLIENRTNKDHLTAAAMALVDLGLYSAKIRLHDIEIAILRRLWRRQCKLVSKSQAPTWLLFVKRHSAHHAREINKALKAAA